MQQSSPVAPWPLVLGVLRQRKVAALRETFGPPHPAQVRSWGRGGAALLLALRAGHQAGYTVGARLEEPGRRP